MKIAVFWLFVCLLLIGAGYGESWQDINGVISFEAEKGTGTWPTMDGKSGKAIFTPLDNKGEMAYTLKISKPGKWWVFLFAGKPAAGDQGDDTSVEVNGEKLWGADNQTRPVGMRSQSTGINWQSRPKGPGSHTPDAIRYKPVYALIDKPGEVVFKFIARSPQYMIDKVAMFLIEDGVNPETYTPTGSGPPETLIGASTSTAGYRQVESFKPTLSVRYRDEKLQVINPGKGGNLSIIALNGALVSHSEDLHAPIDVGMLPSGSYLTLISSEGRMLSSRFLIP